MKTLFCLLLCCLTITIYANDLSLKIDSLSLSENQQLKAGQDHRLSPIIRREDNDTNPVPYVVYYKWNDEAPHKILQSSISTGHGSYSRKINVPILAGQQAILKVYLVSNLDTFASNDTAIINCRIVERYPYDLKITLLKPSGQTNLTTGKPYSLQFNIVNEGTETLRKGEIFQLNAWFDATTLTKNTPHVNYLGEDVKTGDSTIFKHSVLIPEDAFLKMSRLCTILDWVVYEEGSNNYRHLESDQESNMSCVPINIIGLSQEKPKPSILPQLNLRNQQLSFIDQTDNLSYSSIQVFNLSGKLLMSNVIDHSQQTWNFASDESAVVVLLTGVRETHRQLLVKQ